LADSLYLLRVSDWVNVEAVAAAVDGREEERTKSGRSGRSGKGGGRSEAVEVRPKAESAEEVRG
jgi:hypothetical protein